MILTGLDNLTEPELSLLLCVVNVHSPLSIPKMEIGVKELKWFRQDMLNQKIIGAFPALKPEAYPIYSSLLKKLGVEHEIRVEQPAPLPITGSVELQPTGSN